MTKVPKLEGTMKLMAALGRMPPKPHADMKLGKSKAKKTGRKRTTTHGSSAKKSP